MKLVPSCHIINDDQNQIWLLLFPNGTCLNAIEPLKQLFDCPVFRRLLCMVAAVWSGKFWEEMWTQRQMTKQLNQLKVRNSWT